MGLIIPEHYVLNGLFRKKIKEVRREIPDSMIKKIIERNKWRRLKVTAKPSQ